MKQINPIELFLWTFRRNDHDIVNLYDALSDVMILATGGKMLNFGYWENTTMNPIDAQKKLCTIFGKLAKLSSAKNAIDVGSGFGEPAIQWCKEYPNLRVQCVNINTNQLRQSILHSNRDSASDNYIESVNATSTLLPFRTDSSDRILALESAQHFKPFDKFLSESKRVLKEKGILSIAIPILSKNTHFTISKLGMLSFTWSSEHYSREFIEFLLQKYQFKTIDCQLIGSNVYDTLANYYLQNRDIIKNKILQNYPNYVEQILAKSMEKMKQISQKKIIDYMLISCEKT